MLVAMVLFWGFGFSALLMSDDDASNEVLLDLFKAFLLGDGDAFNHLRSLRGADSRGIFPHMLVVMGSVVFTICVLNLFMAVYSNEYDKKSLLETNLFFRERANICFESLLQPGWPNQRERTLVKDMHERGINESRWLKQLLRTETIVVVFSVVLCMISHCSLFKSSWRQPYTAATAFALAELVLQSFTLRCDWLPPEHGKRFYLWICYSRAVFEDQKECSIEELRSEVTSLKQMVMALQRGEQPRIGRVRTSPVHC